MKQKKLKLQKNALQDEGHFSCHMNVQLGRFL